MATWDEVERIALALPETEERPAYGHRAWRVGSRLFVWERPLRKLELEELGSRAPSGPILGAWVEDLFVKEAMLETEPEIYFTTTHFDTVPALLVRLDRISVPALERLTVDAWLARAPKRLAAAYLESLSDREN